MPDVPLFYFISTRYLCLSEAKASHSPKICTEVSSSVSLFLQVGLLLSPITCRCILKVLCPVSRPITALYCVLLKDNNRPAVARLGPEINSGACLCVPQGLRHNAKCCLCIKRFIFLLMFWLFIYIYIYNKTSIKRNILTIKQNTSGSRSGKGLFSSPVYIYIYIYIYKTAFYNRLLKER